MKWTPEKTAELRRLHAARMRYADIAAEVGATTRAVEQKCIVLGLHRLDLWPAKKAAKLRQMRKSGMSFGQIAKKLGTTRNAIAGRVFREAQSA